MIQATKIILIQDLQCRLATWLKDLNKSIGLLQCTDKYYNVVGQVTNLIDVIYRYEAFTEVVTNADVITVNLQNHDEDEIFTINIDYGGTVLAAFSGTGTQDSIVQALVDEINSGTGTHGYLAINDGNIIYLWTYSGTALFTDTPNISISESDAATIELSILNANLPEKELYKILDLKNCLSLEDICNIICKIKSLLNNCNC